MRSPTGKSQNNFQGDWGTKPKLSPGPLVPWFPGSLVSWSSRPNLAPWMRQNKRNFEEEKVLAGNGKL